MGSPPQEDLSSLLQFFHGQLPCDTLPISVCLFLWCWMMGRAVGTVHSELLSFLGVISLSWSLSGKANTLVQLVISAEDGGGLQAQPNARVNISIVEGTVSPPVFEQAQYFFTVPEDTLQGASVGAVRAQNPPGTGLALSYAAVFTVPALSQSTDTTFPQRAAPSWELRAHTDAHTRERALRVTQLRCLLPRMLMCVHTCAHASHTRAHCCCTPPEQSLPRAALSSSSTPIMG